ncbi:hypothetical protein L228DRAFT_245693 [Xylona heveae TC161]|uniref:DUF7580 domain-containing protein n=1 Tax=Xylona heveae (strain CBS 132557 / TC161) TaxID=1328760 RepID=A0A165ICL2_XYLHT|nr:hypothetical protein L228DRAFT_245693 [Xylona heveae TC161]KZF24705.1 hypothetical protein L228DRAFT_245693 [Xylona heveae TC161]
MSALDAVSLGISVVSLGIECLGGKKAILGLVRSTNQIKGINLRIRTELFMWKERFIQQCIKLLAGLKTKEEVQAMFVDDNVGDLNVWQDSAWESQLRAHLGENFEAAMNAIALCIYSFGDIQKALEKTSSSGKGISFTESKQIEREGIKDDILAYRKLSPMTKRRIAGSEDRLRQLLADLRLRIEDYNHIVNNILQSRNTEAVPQRSKTVHVNQKSSIELSSVSAFQRHLNWLHSALAKTVKCHCHGFNLRLEFERDSLRLSLPTNSKHSQTVDHSPPQPVFRLVAVYQEAQSVMESRMDVDEYDSTKRSMIEALEVKSRMVSTIRAPKSASKAEVITTSSSKSKMRKRVSFVFDTADISRKRSLDNQDCRVPRGCADPNIVTAKIDNLCTCLSRLSPSETYLGYVPVDDQHLYLFYRASTVAPRFEERCLRDILQSEDKATCMRVRDRLQLALTLAVSLLYLHSSPWIKQKWRSRDVLLFLDDKKNWAPYVSAKFHQFHNEQAGTENIFRSSNIYSLGVILLEIGRSQLLIDPNSSKGNGREQDGNDEMREFLAAFDHVQAGSVFSDLGLRYQKAVQACIWWDGDFDLSNRETQKRFCDRIVSGLELCLANFDAQ